MIVDPDFVDHWKTRILVGLLEDEAAPIYVLRLWAHCQNRKQDQFENLTTAALKALCRYPGHPNKLESSLLSSGFIRREQETLIVCNWAEYNASLIAAWNNGKTGGRPKKNRFKNPRDNPTVNPAVTHGPTIREDKSRSEFLSLNAGENPDVIVPDKMQTHEVQEAAALWWSHLRLEHPDKVPEPNSPQLQAFWNDASRLGPKGFVDAVNWSAKNKWATLRERPEENQRTGSPKAQKVLQDF